MLWKAGCLVAILGVVVTFSSCALFGRAIQTVTAVHDVANLPIEPGIETIHTGVVVDAEQGLQLRIEATILLTESVLERTRDRANILQLSAPVNYAVLDETGERVHIGAGELAGSTIVPDADSPHRDTLDPKVDVSHSSAVFSVKTVAGTRDRLLTVRVNLPAFDDDENPIVSARAFVVERPLSGAGRWTAGGFASVILGPLVAFVGILLFGIGIFTRRTKSRLPSRPGDVGRL